MFASAFVGVVVHSRAGWACGRSSVVVLRRAGFNPSVAAQAVLQDVQSWFAIGVVRISSAQFSFNQLPASSLEPERNKSSEMKCY